MEQQRNLQPDDSLCPQCGEGSLKLAEGPVLDTAPAQIPIRCSKCGWSGYRWAEPFLSSDALEEDQKGGN